MSRTFTNLLTHLVFSTKNRQPLVVPDFKDELYAYLGGLTKELNGKAYSIGGIDDHVHMLVNLPPVISISDAMRFLKSNSSGWIHNKWPRKPFAWQQGYAAFSVSHSGVADVCRYIANQEEHHQRVSFVDEFMRLLKLNQLHYDERDLPR